MDSCALQKRRRKTSATGNCNVRNKMKIVRRRRRAAASSELLVIDLVAYNRWSYVGECSENKRESRNLISVNAYVAAHFAVSNMR